jgi:hypothetical protein
MLRIPHCLDNRLTDGGKVPGGNISRYPQFRNVQFEVTPADHNCICIISGEFMGAELEKIKIDIQGKLKYRPFLILLTEPVTPKFPFLIYVKIPGVGHAVM